MTIIWLSQLVISVLLWQSHGSPQLVGRWDSEGRSRGGIGTTLTLSEDGKCSKTTGAMVDGRWTLAAGQLTIVLTDDGKPDKQVISVTITGDTMTQLTDGERRNLKRVNPPGRVTEAIEGVWSYPHYAGGTAYEDYEPDGRFLFRLPIRTDPCSWTASANHLKLIMDGEADFRWEITEGGRLTLEHGGERETFHRENSILPSAGKP